MIKSIRFWLVLSLVMIISGCTKYTSLRHRENYADNYSSYHQLLVMPIIAEVNVTDIGNKKERMYDYEYHIQDLISEHIIAVVEHKNFKAKLLHKKDIKELELGRDISNFRAKYNQVRQELYHPLLLEESKAFKIDKSLGEVAIKIGEKTNSDLLLVVDYAGLIKTNGARVRDLAMSLLFKSHAGAEAADNSVMFIGIIEAKSGNIIWANNTFLKEDIYTSAWNNMKAQDKVEIEKIKTLITGALLPLKTKI